MRAWRDVERSFISSVPDLWDLESLLQLDVELAHALVLVLSRVPSSARRQVADRFYAERRGYWRTTPDSKARAAAAAVIVLPLTGRPDLHNERVADLLTAMHQRDDLGLTPPHVIVDLQKAVARARLDLCLEDQLEHSSAATLAVLEVLDPPADVPASQEVLMRATWARLESGGVDSALAFLLALDALATIDADD